MNRSVISWTIAAGVLCAAASGIVAAPVAVAEPAQQVTSNDADAGSGGAGAPARGPRNPGRGGKPSAEGAAPSRPTPGSLPLWPCQWPVIPPVIPDTKPDAGGDSDIPVGRVPIVPLPVSQTQFAADTELAIPDLPDLEALPAPAVGGQIEPAPVLAPARMPQPLQVAAAPNRAGPAAPAATVPRDPATQRAPRAAAVPPAAVPSLPAPPATAVDAGQTLRPETLRPETLRPETLRPETLRPETLPSADAVALATNALPGLAVILVMTAVGGLVGYRQAKAGSVLRAAGAGRFLR